MDEQADISKRLALAEIRAERSRVVMESLAGFCHALGQPATVLLSAVELLKMDGVDAETKKGVLDMCYDAALEIKSLLAQMKEKREYANEAYLAGNERAGTMIALKEWREKNNVNFYTDGLKIYTTLDSRMQTYAEEAVLEKMYEIQQRFNGRWGSDPCWVDEEGNESELKLDPAGSPIAFVFNTVADQYGKNSYFKVISGDMEDTLTVVNVRTGDSEKLGNMFFPKGKDNTKTSKVCCGDIGVFTKLASVKTGDTLGLPGKTVRIKGMTYDEPMYKMAVYAKVKGTEDKIANGLVKLKEEDESFTYGNDPETKELIIAGAGDMQLSVLMAKLQSKYKVEAVLKPAKIAYRETIKKKVEIHGRHKKQSGGHGQFGDVYIRFEPQSESEEMIFADETVGGCVPKNFIPSVEKGLRNCVGKGVLAGYPVVFLKATLYFGSYHPVDSSDMAFQTAAGIAYKEGLPTAGPTLLEPIGELKVLIPDANMGDVIGDLNKRRGRVMGMNPDPENPGYQIVEAEVPVGEMTTYSIDLRAMSQGRGSYTLKFVRYEEVPQMNQAKIIEDAKKEEEEA